MRTALPLRPVLVVALLALACGGSSSGGAAPLPAPSPAPTLPAGVTITYVALGDSAGVGVGALPLGSGGYPERLARRLRETGHPVELVNLSIPGAQASDLAGRPLEELARYAPRLVTVCIGANDAAAERSAAEFGVDLDTLLGKVAELRAAVVVCNVPDVSLTPKYRGDGAMALRVVDFNAEVARAAARHGFAVADVYRASRERLFEDPSLISFDGFHPSAAGYEVWADAMLPAAKAVLGLP